MKTVVRLATGEDQVHWTRLRHESWPDCPPERHALEAAGLLTGDGLVAVASVDGTLVGFAEASLRRDHVEGTSIVPVPYLEGWYVAEAHRGRGIGRALLAFVEQWATEAGYSELASDAELGNAASIRLHFRLGFREVGRGVHFVKTLPAPGSSPRSPVAAPTEGFPVHPIGHVESSLRDRARAPKQGDEGAPPAWLVFYPPFRDALADLQVGDAVLVLTWLDRADRTVLQVHPRHDRSQPLRGAFSTRSPDRPNPVGLHRTKIVAIADRLRIQVQNLEALDRTPIIDLKPALSRDEG